LADIRSDAPVLVIGLGRFGAATAGQLDRQDREVLVIDTDMQLVQKWADRVTHAVQADARSMEALRQVGADQFQIAVVATGASIESSVLIASNLVDLGVPQIWAKAISQSHGKILERIGVNHVIYPEREAAPAERQHARLHPVRRQLRDREDVPTEIHSRVGAQRQRGAKPLPGHSGRRKNPRSRLHARDSRHGGLTA